MTWFNEPSSIHSYKEVTNTIIILLAVCIFCVLLSKEKNIVSFVIENIRKPKEL